MPKFLWYRQICADQHVEDIPLVQPADIAALRAFLFKEDDRSRPGPYCHRRVDCLECGAPTYPCLASIVGFAGFEIPYNQNGEPTHAEVSEHLLVEHHLACRIERATVEQCLQILRQPHAGSRMAAAAATPLSIHPSSDDSFTIPA